jgi:Uma2 family endonuclease
LGLPLETFREAGQQTEYDSSRLVDVCVVTLEQANTLVNQSAVFQSPSVLAVEIVSPSSIQRDYEKKPLEYANKGVPEYWIVDPLQEQVTILLLDGGSYQRSVYQDNQLLNSRTFPKLKLTPAQVFGNSY